MKKTYVLDTNVLIQTPEALECFEDNEVVLPLAVLEELDNLKKAEGEKGENARKAIRRLEQFRTRGNLLEGVALPGGGVVRVERNFVDVPLPEELPEEKMDNRILKICLGLTQRGETETILVTKDILLRLKAQITGIRAEDFEREQVSDREEQYEGRTEVYAPEEKFREFKKKGIPVEDVYTVDENGERTCPELTENEFVLIRADQSNRKTQLGRVEHGKLVKLEYRKSMPYGVTPRNAGQYFLQEALMQPAKKSASCHCERDGRYKQDLLFPCGRAGKAGESSGRGVPENSDLPAQCTVRFGHRISSGR